MYEQKSAGLDEKILTGTFLIESSKSSASIVRSSCSVMSKQRSGLRISVLNIDYFSCESRIIFRQSRSDGLT